MHIRVWIVGAVIAFLIGTAAAVEPGQPSKTSILVTARRALTARDYDPSIRNPDWLAEHFLGPVERAIMPGAVKSLDQDYREAIRGVSAAGIFLVRTRFIDERLQAAVKGGATQVVILGAGYDSRAYRMKEFLKSTKVFEVDYGPTQEYKKIRVREVLGCLPPNLTYVAIDFTREKLGDVLVKAGYQSNQRTVFIWEGVTYYIPEDAVRSTLRFVATQSAPRSSIVLDGQSKSFIDWVVSHLASPEKVPDVLRPILVGQKTFADWGEPWIFGFPDGLEGEFLKSVGLEMGELLPIVGPEATKRYLTRSDGTALTITPPTAPLGAAPPFRWGGWLAEAVVSGR